jgi:hypothetical protein
MAVVGSSTCSKQSEIFEIKQPELSLAGDLIDEAKESAYKAHLCFSIALFAIAAVGAAICLGVAIPMGVSVLVAGVPMYPGLVLPGIIATMGLISVGIAGANVLVPLNEKHEIYVLSEWKELTSSENPLSHLRKLLDNKFNCPDEKGSFKEIFTQEAYEYFPVKGDQKDRWLAFIVVEVIRKQIGALQNTQQLSYLKQIDLADSTKAIVDFCDWISKKVELNDEQRAFLAHYRSLKEVDLGISTWLNELGGNADYKLKNDKPKKTG